MDKPDFVAFVEQNINDAAQAITLKGNVSDDVALGKLNFYLVLRRELLGQRTPEGLGLLGAINDSLQALGIIDQKHSFLGYLKAASEPTLDKPA